MGEGELTRTRIDELFAEVREARRAGDTAREESLLVAVHEGAHHLAGAHLRAHVAHLGLSWRTRRPLEFLRHFAALPFAAPASWVHRYLGLSRYRS